MTTTSGPLGQYTYYLAVIIHYIIIVIIVYRRAHIKVCLCAGDLLGIFTLVYLGPGLGHNSLYCDNYIHTPPDRRISICCHRADSCPFTPFVFVSLSLVSGPVFHFHLPRAVRISHRETHDVRCSLIALLYYIYDPRSSVARYNNSSLLLYPYDIININLNAHTSPVI